MMLAAFNVDIHTIETASGASYQDLQKFCRLSGGVVLVRTGVDQTNAMTSILLSTSVEPSLLS